jgi:tyrosyl-tRNA synthetase
MDRYYLLLLSQKTPAIHPMDAKKQLACSIVERYHSKAAADTALNDFNLRFSKKDLVDADLPKVTLNGSERDIVSVVVTAYAAGFSMTKSRGDARRLVEQGSVQLNGEKITEPKATPAFKAGDVLRLDKTRAVRLEKV